MKSGFEIPLGQLFSVRPSEKGDETNKKDVDQGVQAIRIVFDLWEKRDQVIASRPFKEVTHETICRGLRKVADWAEMNELSDDEIDARLGAQFLLYQEAGKRYLRYVDEFWQVMEAISEDIFGAISEPQTATPAPSLASIDSLPLFEPFEQATRDGDLLKYQDGTFEVRKSLNDLAETLPSGILTADIVRRLILTPEERKPYGETAIANAVAINNPERRRKTPGKASREKD